MIRTAEAQWSGTLKEGKGHVKVETGALDSPYSFKSRFTGGGETNPEELLGASHAGCFSMQLAAMLTAGGHPPTSIRTKASVHLEQDGPGFKISKIELDVTGEVPGLDAAGFEATATQAKTNCPISKALASTPITMVAKLA